MKPPNVASLYNVGQGRRRSAAGGRSNAGVRKIRINSMSNYTPILPKNESIGSSSLANKGRFKKRLGTEPFILSEG